jgi:hypothetical protein
MSHLKMVQREFSNFCSTASIHGMAKIFDGKQNFVSRLLWIVIIVASFVAAGICIKATFDGMQTFNLTSPKILKSHKNRVKPVYNAHPWDPKKVAVVHWWSLCRGSSIKFFI